MSYLAALRLHFAGKFQAAPSTVNNDPTHYDNATFKPEYQKRGTGTSNGWWNPRGNADWRLVGCSVTGAFLSDGSPAAPDDPVRAALVADSDVRVPAKMVDLDPEQQLVSEIWGLEVRITDRGGNDLVRGTFQTAAFMDIWTRAAGGGGDINACTSYQSVLSDVEWGDVGDSAALSAMRAAATDGLLSIKFNVDGYNMDFTSPDFTMGRVVGTIGVASRAEASHMVSGRQFLAVDAPSSPLFSPEGKINFFTAVVDEGRGKVLCDLGNALPTTTTGGPLADLGDLTLGYLDEGQLGESAFVPLGQVEYRTDAWYEQTAGVSEVPAEGTLTATELAAIAESRLAVVVSSSPDVPAITESPGGVALRPDRFVYRLDPGDTADVTLIATRFGRPYPGAGVVVVDYPDQLQGPDPVVNDPTSAISYPSQLVTGEDGTVTLTVVASDPGNPRGYIDGQVYGVRAALAETAQPGSTYPFDPWEFVSLLVADAFTPDEPPSWWGSVQPIFLQYANLYPVMDTFLDLSDYESVCANVGLLLLAFGLDPENPNSMPVTRDLSGAKRQTILRWLSEPGPDGKPLLGTPPTPQLSRLVERAVEPLPDRGGGKASAAARRVVVRRAGAAHSAGEPTADSTTGSAS